MGPIDTDRGGRDQFATRQLQHNLQAACSGETEPGFPARRLATSRHAILTAAPTGDSLPAQSLPKKQRRVERTPSTHEQPAIAGPVRTARTARTAPPTRAAGFGAFGAFGMGLALLTGSIIACSTSFTPRTCATDADCGDNVCELSGGAPVCVAPSSRHVEHWDECAYHRSAARARHRHEARHHRRVGRAEQAGRRSRTPDRPQLS